MDIYKFKLAPTDTNFQNLFALTENALSEWLDSLENTSNSGAQNPNLLCVIQAIHKEEGLLTPKKSVFLQSIYKALPIYLQPLQTKLLNSALPLSSKEQSDLEHIVWIYAELANGFAGCTTKKNNPENAHTLFYGLQSLIIAYIHISQVYQQPFPNFWKQSYLFYGLACKFEIQDLEIEQHTLHSNTISKAFKYLMALYHCGLEQFRPRDILELSTCMEKHTSSMLIDKKISNSTAAQYSAFDLNSDTPPSAIHRLVKTEKNAFRFFSAYTAAIKISKKAPQRASGTGILKSINQENILRAAKTLSLTQNRKYTRLNKQKNMSGIIGFKSIVDELTKTTSLKPNVKTHKKVTQYESKEIGGWKVPDLELVAEGHDFLDVMTFSLDQASLLSGQQKQKGRAKHLSIAENNFDDEEKNIVASEEDDSAQQNQISDNYPELDISDSSIKGYKIIFDTLSNDQRLQIGDVISIKNNTSTEIGIIHRITQLTDHKLQLGIKLLALDSEIAYISFPKQESVYAWALFLPGIKALNLTDSIIFNDSKFQCGEFVSLHREEQEPVSYRLSELLHLSSAATQIELFHSNMMNESSV